MADGTPAAVRIDARGLLCPWPALRLARALRETRGAVEIRVDDDRTDSELREVARAAGRRLAAAADDPSLFRVEPVRP